MRVKRFVVDSMPDALQQIRSDLGRDAVILNTKEVRSGGIFGLFTRKQIEVIAATDENKRASVSKPVPPIQTEAPLAPNLNTGRAAVAVMDKPTEMSVNHISEEIKQMKQMMVRMLEKDADGHVFAGHFKAIEQQLLAHDFELALIQDVLIAIMDSASEPLAEMSRETAVSLVKEQLKQIIPQQSIQGIREGTKLVHIVGPTGVGKTTTIAKLAAEQVLKRGKKVGFITSDTYRIAAIEQLKTYATILNVPLEVVSSPQDLTVATESLADRDIIFMDTAGRNYRNQMYVSELNSLLRHYENSETILTLSLTMKYKDMKSVTQNFSKFKVDKVLFTKKDETESYGSIFNIANEFPVQLSYITHGQNVPDDIATVDIDHIIDSILEDAANE